MKRIAVIGAGPAGITSLKTAKDYGHKVTCFEREATFGGTWDIGEARTKDAFETLEKGQGYGTSPSYSSLMMNTSSTMSAYSDFPIQECTFLKHKDYMEYLRNYVSHFDLLKHMQFNTTVTKLEKKTGANEWMVKVASVNENGVTSEREEVFDFVIIANGPFRHPCMPDIDGLDSFTGQVVHSAQVRNVDKLFKDKLVLITGSGNSAFELTSSALKAGAKKVFMTVVEERRNQFIGNHCFPDPRQDGRLLPYDCYFVTWHSRDQGAEGGQKFLSTWSKPVKKSITADHIFEFPKDGTIVSQRDLVEEAEAKGTFERVSGVVKVSGSSVELADKRVLSDVDVIVCCTGYTTRFPMLNDVWPVEEQEKCELYRYMVSPDASMDGLIFVGTTNSLSASLMPIMEIQARFACEKIFNKELASGEPLFSDTERVAMKEEIEEVLQLNRKFDRCFSFIVDVPAYAMKMATDMGCTPPDYKVMLSPGNSREEQELGLALYHGPIISAQYRLRGQKPWEGAKQHIIATAKQVLGKHYNVLLNQYLK